MCASSGRRGQTEKRRLEANVRLLLPVFNATRKSCKTGALILFDQDHIQIIFAKELHSTGLHDWRFVTRLAFMSDLDQLFSTASRSVLRNGLGEYLQLFLPDCEADLSTFFVIAG